LPLELFKLVGVVTTDTSQAERGLKNVDGRARDAGGRFIQAEGSAKKFKTGLDQTGSASRKFGGDLGNVAAKAKDTNSAVSVLTSGLAKLRSQAAQGIKLGAVEGLSGSGGLMSALLSGNPVTGLVAGGVSKLIGGVTSQISSAIEKGFDFNKIKEQAILGFEVKLGGDRKAAEDFFDQVNKFAEKAPQELDQVLDSTNKMMIAFSSKEALYALDAITDAVSAQGKVGGEAAEQINGVGLQLQQMLLKGKVSAEETTSLAERGIKVYKYLGDEIAKTDAQFAALTDTERISEVQRRAEKGLLNARTAVAVTLRGMKAEYNGAAERAAKETLGGIQSNINDRQSRLYGQATQNAFERYKVLNQQFLNGLNSQVGDNVANSINGTVGTFIGRLDETLNAIKSGDLTSLGFEAAKSAAQGITSAGDFLFDAGANIFGMTDKGWRTAADQHSPSQVMLDLGFEAAISAATGVTQAEKFLFDSGASVAMQFQKGFAQGVKKFKPEIEKLIEENARRTGLDPDLLRSMMKQESGGNRKAVSNKGASGLMQLMPQTARSLGVTNIFDPAQNIAGGADYMAMLMKRFRGDTRKALAGYNAGPGRVDQFGGVPPPSFAKGETYNYVRSIMADYERRKMITGASGDSSRLVSQTRPALDQLSAGVTGTFGQTNDLYARRAATEGDLLRGLLSQRDSSKTALNALMQDAQKRLQWAEKLPQGTQGEREIRERMMFGATETIAAIQRDLDDFLNGINEQIANAQGRLQDAVLRLGTDAPQGMTWQEQAKREGWQMLPKTPAYDSRGRLAGFDTPDERPPALLDLTKRDGIQSVFGVGASASLRATQQLNKTLQETPKALEKISATGSDAFGSLPPLIKQVEKDNGRLIKQLDDFADRTTDTILRGFDEGWAGAREGLRDLLLDMTREAMNSKLRGVLHDLFNVKSKDAEQEGSGGGFDLSSAIGGIFNRNKIPTATAPFNPNAKKDTMPSAVRDAGQEAVSAVTKAGQATAQTVQTTGDATTRGLGNVSQNLLSGLGQVANMIAVSNSGGGFWKGLFGAAAIGGLNGLIGGIFAPKSGGGGLSNGVPVNTGGSVITAWTGGLIKGAGTATSDSINARLSNGEYVIKAATVNKFGKGFFDVLNAGTMPKIAHLSGGGAFASNSYAPPSLSLPAYTPAAFKTPAYTPAPINLQAGARAGAQGGARRSGDVRLEGDMIFNIHGAKNPEEFKRNLSKAQIASEMRAKLREGTRNE